MAEIKRVLLPFTHGINIEALEYAVRFARSCQATLVSLAVMHLPERLRSNEPRLEAIAQANDFLEAMQHKANKAAVPMERFALVTRDVSSCINAFAQEMSCDGILLFPQRNSSALLTFEVMQQLLEKTSCPLYLIHLPSSHQRQSVLKRFKQHRDLSRLKVKLPA